MKKALVRGHRVAFSDYRESLPNNFDIICQILDEAIDEHDDVTFRTDARQFLLVNVVELVAKPQTASADYQGTRYQLTDDVIERLKMIIRTVVSTAAKRPDEKGKISGHQVLRTVDDVWPEIKAGGKWA